MDAQSPYPRRPPPPPPPRREDPRHIVTQDAFQVPTELLGTPLARPWRRAAAMLVDGLLIAVLANAASVLFALAAALLLFRASATAQEQGYVRKGVRILFRFGGALALFIFALSTWDWLFDHDDADSRSGRAVAEAGLAGVGGAADAEADVAGALEAAAARGEHDMSPAQALALGAEMLALIRSDSPESAGTAVERMVRRLRGAGLSHAEIHEILVEVGADIDAASPDVAAALDSVTQALADSIVVGADAEAPPDAGAVPLPAEQLPAAYAAAAERGDSAELQRLRPLFVAAVADDTLARLNEALAELREDRAELEAAVVAAQEEPGLFERVRSVLGDLWLSFGWSGLYFTGFIALWSGRTPGKRLLGIRVIRLNCKPISWWIAFERFGGYAASFSMLLLGFAQILWDPNRQGVHDKIAETVVVVDRG